jgi:hypothetical protein
MPLRNHSLPVIVTLLVASWREVVSAQQKFTITVDYIQAPQCKAFSENQRHSSRNGTRSSMTSSSERAIDGSSPMKLRLLS